MLTLINLFLLVVYSAVYTVADQVIYNLLISKIEFRSEDDIELAKYSYDKQVSFNGSG